MTVKSIRPRAIPSLPDNKLYTQDKVNFSGEAKAHRTDAGTTTMGLEDQFTNADTTNFKNVTLKR